MPLLSATTSTGDAWLEEVVAGLEVTAIGMAVVFSVLIVLYLLLTLLGRFLADAPPATAQAPPAPQAKVETAAAAATPADELTAVIAAAIAVATSKPGHDAARLLPGRPAARIGWALAGRMEQAASRELWREERGR